MAKVRRYRDFIKQIEQAKKRAGGEDSNFTYALAFHLNNLVYSRLEEELESQDEMCEALLSKMFMDKMDLFPTQPFICKVDENSSNWPLKPMPSEFFGYEKYSDTDKLRWFYMSLKVGDVLDCRVSTVSTVQNSCQLRVIHKYGVPKVFDDLSIMVELICIKNEMKILRQQLLVCEFVRVAVCKIHQENDTVTVYVTVDSDSIPFEPVAKLGRITESDVPSYVSQPPDMEKFSCYADYLKSEVKFHEPHFYSELFKECGGNPYVTYSYFPQFNTKECAEEHTGQALLKESYLTATKNKASSALKALKRKQYTEALKLINEGIDICPKEDPLYSKVLSIRSDIYADQAGPGKSLKSFCDLEKAFSKVTLVDDKVKENFIKQVFKTANVLYIERKFKKAIELYEFVLQHDENHSLARQALTAAKERHASKLMDLEDTSLVVLHEQKKKLLSELKKIK